MAKKSTSANTDQNKIVRPSRSLGVFGEINAEMVSELTPKILALQQASSDPITLLIDSLGGSVQAADVLAGLLKSPNQAGMKTWVNAIVTGHAASAAAHLLSTAEYAISYQHSRIHFHGAYTNSSSLTAERAYDLMQDLGQSNRSASLALAQAAFWRFLDVYSRLAESFTETRDIFRNEIAHYDKCIASTGLDISALAFALMEQLTPAAAGIVLMTLDELARLWSALSWSKTADFIGDDPCGSPLFQLLRTSKPRRRRRDLAHQTHILLALLAQRISGSPDWDIASENFQLLKRDFEFLMLASSPTFEPELLSCLARYQTLFMSASDLRYFNRFQPADLDKNARLRVRYDRVVDNAYKTVQPLWFFMTTLFRILHAGENTIEPRDAWWLGLVDEVLGTKLMRRTPSREQQRALEQIVD